MIERKRIVFPVIAVLLTVAEIIGQAPVSAAAGKVQVSAPSGTIQVGQRLALKERTKGVRYSSSNSVIASVSDSGVVTGKQAGTVKITARKSGYQPKTVKIHIKAGKKKPSLAVSPDEAKLQSVQMKQCPDGSYEYSAMVKNTAKKGCIDRIKYFYDIQVRGGTGSTAASGSALALSSYQTSKKRVVLTADHIKPGKKSKRVKCEGDYTGKRTAMKLVKVILYTGEAVYTYHPDTDTGKLEWNKKDMTGPVFSGWVGKQSIYNGEPVWTCYSDRKRQYNFKENVKAVDARDGKVSFSVDISRVNWNKEGIYKVYYTAKDKSGNQSRAWAKVQVYQPGRVEKMADIILSSTAGSGTDVQKLQRIYAYVQGHCSYTGSGSHHNWRQAAENGIKNQSGDCFTYYSIAKLLISRAGFPNLTVRRYPYREGSNHWWNLIYVKEGWYHFDTTPRSRKGYFCLQTDEQLHMYSTGSTFRFQTEKYPKRAKRRISRNPI